MEQSNLEFVIAKLNALPGRANWDLVGEYAGVPGSTVEKIARGYVKNPRFETVEKLAKCIRENPLMFVRKKSLAN